MRRSMSRVACGAGDMAAAGAGAGAGGAPSTGQELDSRLDKMLSVQRPPCVPRMSENARRQFNHSFSAGAHRRLTE